MAIQSSGHLFLRMYENLESKGFFASRTEDTTFEIRLRSLLKEHKKEVHKKDMEQRMMMCTVARMFCLLPVQNHELNLLKNSFLSQEFISLEFYTHLVKKLTEHMPSEFNYLVYCIHDSFLSISDLISSFAVCNSNIKHIF